MPRLSVSSHYHLETDYRKSFNICMPGLYFNVELSAHVYDTQTEHWFLTQVNERGWERSSAHGLQVD